MFSVLGVALEELQSSLAAPFLLLQVDRGYEVSRNVGELHGVERSARAAAYMVEDAWFKAIRGSSLDVPAPRRNAYAMAEGGVDRQ